MSYMLLIVEPTGQRKTRTEAEGRALYDSMLRYSDSLKARGLLTMSQSLKDDARGLGDRDSAASRTGRFSIGQSYEGAVVQQTAPSRFSHNLRLHVHQ